MPSPSAPADVNHLALCPACAALNGQSATACWSCETALTPADLIPAAAASAHSADAWAALLRDQEQDPHAPELASPPGLAAATSPTALSGQPARFNDAPVWGLSANAAAMHPPEPPPVLTEALEHYRSAVTQAQIARQRLRLMAAGLGALGVVAVAAFVYVQMSAPDAPTLDTSHAAPDMAAARSPVAPDGMLPVTPAADRQFPALGATPSTAAAPVRPPPQAATNPAPENAAPSSRVVRAPEMQRPPRPIAPARADLANAPPPSAVVPSTAPALTTPAAAPAPREPCTAAVTALGLCSPP